MGFCCAGVCDCFTDNMDKKAVTALQVSTHKSNKGDEDVAI
jgi:hypothetical protein